MIIVKPNGGLGNRMRVINSALCLSFQNNNAAVKVLWKKYEGMNARFTDIFNPVDDLYVTSNIYLMSCYFYSWKLLPIGFRYYDDKSILDNQFNETHWNRDHSNAILNTCHDFYQLNAATNFYHLFHPIDRLQIRIDEHSADFQGLTAGVHIRRKDNVPAIDNSKTEDFIKKMNEILEENDSAKFYLSTDDPDTENQLKQRFGRKIYTIKHKKLDRNSKGGIEDALIDMYCLSRTNLILGSYSSSFSAVAAAIGKIPLQIIKL